MTPLVAVRAAAIAALLAVLATACGTAPSPVGSSPTPAATEQSLAVAVASFDLAVGDQQRFIAGVLTPDRQVIGSGEVRAEFFFLGEADASGQPQPLSTTTATFLPVPGKEPGTDGDAPTVLDDPEAAGVYETTVDLPRPGFYGVAVTAEVDGQERSGTASFEVAAEHQVPAVGEPAPKSRNLTLDSDGPPAAIDSRAGTDGKIPDPHLHRTTIADAVGQGRPAVTVFSTPVYCVSRFCGPITETVADLAEQYSDRAAFVHVEVWRDFDAGQLNDAAAEWIQTAEGGNEPWVFLIAADGTIAARWDNVLDRGELEALLRDLPASPAE
jgi:hypothetical protein